MKLDNGIGGGRESSPRPASELFELEFGFDLLPRNERFASVLRDSCFEIAQVFEIFNAFLESNHGLIERLDLFENGSFSHTLSFDLSQHKPEWLPPPERREHGTYQRGADTDCLCL